MCGKRVTPAKCGKQGLSRIETEGVFLMRKKFEKKEYTFRDIGFKKKLLFLFIVE